MQKTVEEHTSWLDRPISAAIKINWETIILTVILLLAVVTRFYHLESRVMSHDETSHVYFSWLLEQGRGYAHDPITHGPLQFHLVALSYFLFGDNDFSARIPAALFSIAAVAFVWKFRRYLGRAGTLAAALMFTISPYMLYYGRYVRNEAFVTFFGLVTLWSILRYLESGENRHLYFLTLATILHFTAKETAFIYTAQALLFFAFYFIYWVSQNQWPVPAARKRFLQSLFLASLLFAGAAAPRLLAEVGETLNPGMTAVPAVPGQDQALDQAGVPPLLTMILSALAGAVLISALFFLISGQNRKLEQGLNKSQGYLLMALVALPALMGLILGYGYLIGQSTFLTQGLAGAVPTPDGQVDWITALRVFGGVLLVLIPPLLAGAALLFVGRYLLARFCTIWPSRHAARSFDLILLLGSLVLPLLSAFLINLIGNPTDYSFAGMIKTAIILIPLSMLAIGTGLGWNPRQWLINAGIFYAVFIILYTTIFTNGSGFFTGLVGSLGYWLEQQGVQRGNQPWYYYILLQVPFYEFLPALGSILALFIALFRRRDIASEQEIEDRERELAPHELEETGENTPHPVPIQEELVGNPNPANPGFSSSKAVALNLPRLNGAVPVLALLGFWSVSSLLAYTIAGEKMPWLTVHIALPLILLAAWSAGYLIETTDWRALRSPRGYLVVLLLPVFLTSLVAGVGSLLGTNRPFQGSELAQLRSTSTFLTGIITAILSGWGLVSLIKTWTSAQINRVFTLVILTFLALLTARSAFIASYINYDNTKEYLVYAHSGPGAKLILDQLEEISRRINGSLEMGVAYDDATTYPFWWYLRNFPNQRYFAANPTRDLREYPAIIVGDGNYGKIEPVVGQAYHNFEYVRMWWPNQAYFNLTWERVWNALVDPQWRVALFRIWLNRDYSLYGQLTQQEMSLTKWSPANQMRLYLRKDIVAQVWNYGVTSEVPVVADPYEGKQINLAADLALGSAGTSPGQFNMPRSIAVAPDGSLYVADTGNHRIQHLTYNENGLVVLDVWGSFADLALGQAPGGTFNEPWGISVGPDGSVYVADTWNHRIQKFSSAGEFITMWGYFSQGEAPEAFWGPRDVAVDALGRVFVSDTGNKRIVIFDENGNTITEFGAAGFAPGQFAEPVGIALDGEGRIYVADTWNQRVQVIAPGENGEYAPLNSWEIVGWYGESRDNKPYIAVDPEGHVFVTDPEGYRVLEFTREGEFVRFWGDYGTDLEGMSIPNGIKIDHQGGVWIADSGNNRLLHYTLPQP